MSLPPLLPPALPRPTRHSPDWLSRNWKWLVLVILGLVVAGAVSFFALLFGLMKSSDAYQGALLRVKNDPAVILALGEPVEEGFLFTGQIQIKNDSGWADLSLPFSGPKASATAHVKATKKQGTWHFDRLIVEVEGSERPIDLSEETPSPGQALER